MVETSTTNSTPVNTDDGLMEENRDNNTANVVKSNEQDDQKQTGGTNVQDFQCRFCTSRSFDSKPDLLQHLSLIHFNKNLLERFPFKVGSPSFYTAILISCYLCRREASVQLRDAR